MALCGALSGSLWWFVVICGDFCVVVCGGSWWFVVVRSD